MQILTVALIVIGGFAALLGLYVLLVVQTSWGADASLLPWAFVTASGIGLGGAGVVLLRRTDRRDPFK